MTTEQLQKLKEVIWKANPSILELKFGCEVAILFDDSDFYGKVRPEWIKRPIYKVSEQKAVVYIVDPPFPNNAINVQERLKKREFKILGRPITLADVLLACMKTIWNGQLSTGVKNNMYKISYIWNMFEDLDHQPDETKSFLYDLLVKEGE